MHAYSCLSLRTRARFSLACLSRPRTRTNTPHSHACVWHLTTRAPFLVARFSPVPDTLALHTDEQEGRTYYTNLSVQIYVNASGHFNPAHIGVQQGTMVTWLLSTFESAAVHADDGTWHSKRLNRNGGADAALRFSIQFGAPSEMDGTVVTAELARERRLVDYNVTRQGVHAYSNPWASVFASSLGGGRVDGSGGAEGGGGGGGGGGSVLLRELVCSELSDCTACLLYTQCIWCAGASTCMARNPQTNLPIDTATVVVSNPDIAGFTREYHLLKYYDPVVSSFGLRWYPWPQQRSIPRPARDWEVPVEYFVPVSSDNCPAYADRAKGPKVCPEYVMPGPRVRIHGRETAGRPQLDMLLTCYDYLQARYGRPPSVPPPYTHERALPPRDAQPVTTDAGHDAGTDAGGGNATRHASNSTLLDANGTDAGGSPGDASAGDGHGDGEQQLRRRLVDIDSAAALAAALDTTFAPLAAPSDHRAAVGDGASLVALARIRERARLLHQQQPAASALEAGSVRGDGRSRIDAERSHASRAVPGHSQRAVRGETLDGDEGDRSVRGSGAAAAGGGVASLAVATASSASPSATEGAGPLPSRWLEPESAEHAARRRLQQSLSDLQREALLLRPHSELTASEIVLLAPDWQRRLLPTAQIGKDGALEMMQSLLRAEYGESLCNATCGPHTHAPYMRARARLLPHSCVSAPHALRAISLLLFSLCAPLVAPLPRKPI